jgi:hypothetical protein
MIGRNVLKHRAEAFGVDHPEGAPLFSSASTIRRGPDGGSQRHAQGLGTKGDGVPRRRRVCAPEGMKPVLLLEPLDMTTIFAVVGERRNDPLALLRLREDGQHDADPLPDGPVTPVEPDEQGAVDRAQPVMEELLA